MSYTDPPFVRRYSNNPILSPEDVPYGCARVYNPAACKVGDRYALVLRTGGVAQGTRYLGCASNKKLSVDHLIATRVDFISTTRCEKAPQASQKTS